MIDPRLEALRTRGFFVEKGLVGGAVLDAAGDAALRLLSSQTEEDRKKHAALGSLIRTWNDPGFLDLILDPNAIALFRALGFTEPRFSNGYLFSKPARSGPTFWHQDWCFWNDPISLGDAPPQIGLLYPLSDTRIENGCPRFLPGSHRKRAPLHAILEKSDIFSLRRMDDPSAPPFRGIEGEVSVPVERGSVIVFDARTLHAAHPNRSDVPRSVITFWYFPDFGALSERVRARIGDEAPPDSWPGEAKARIAPWLAHYRGTAEPAEIVLHPQSAFR